jgi:hypothetical protein
MLTKEEEVEIEQQAEQIKAERVMNMSYFAFVVFLVITGILIYSKGSNGWYFLAGGLVMAIFTGWLKNFSDKIYK